MSVQKITIAPLLILAVCAVAACGQCTDGSAVLDGDLAPVGQDLAVQTATPLSASDSTATDMPTQTPRPPVSVAALVTPIPAPTSTPVPTPTPRPTPGPILIPEPTEAPLEIATAQATTPVSTDTPEPTSQPPSPVPSDTASTATATPEPSPQPTTAAEEQSPASGGEAAGPAPTPKRVEPVSPTAVSTPEIEATATATSADPAPTAVPTKTPEETLLDEFAGLMSHMNNSHGGSSPCGPIGWWPFVGRFSEFFLDWNADGSQIVFGHGTSIIRVGSDGSGLRRIVDMNPSFVFYFGMHADLSPSDSRIVYSSCGHRTEPPPGTWSSPIWRPLDLLYTVDTDRRFEWTYNVVRRNYEIVTANLNGGEMSRLTDNIMIDHYPVWSPDGTRIAFLSSLRGAATLFLQLHTMAADGSDVQLLTPTLDRLHLSPPVWSRDGDTIAFLVNEQASERDLSAPLDRTADVTDAKPVGALYTVGADGSGLVRVVESSGMPAWSPDGSQLAFVSGTEESSGLYLSNPDGSGLQRIADAPEASVYWSPDGAELLLLGDGVELIRPDGTDRRVIPVEDVVAAAWSPDSSRIALQSLRWPTSDPHFRYDEGDFYSSGSVQTVARDGSDPLTLVNWKFESRFTPPVLVPSGPQSEEMDTGLTCESGLAVPEPSMHPGLVQDCTALLALAESLGGRGYLNWRADTRLVEWDGVTVSGSPLRVRRLELPDRELMGTMVSAIGDLDALEVIDLRGNFIRGELPIELTILTNLQRLHLGGNYISGPIPAELTQLRKLVVLNLSSNSLKGQIPRELGELTGLIALSLFRNQLIGTIPGELGDLVNLRMLSLGGNDLSGPLPVEFGQLKELIVLAYDETQRDAGIPQEILELPNLELSFAYPPP